MTYSGHQRGPFTATLVALLTLVPAGAFAQAIPAANAPDKTQQVRESAAVPEIPITLSRNGNAAIISRNVAARQRLIDSMAPYCPSLSICESALAEAQEALSHYAAQGGTDVRGDILLDIEFFSAVSKYGHYIKDEHPELTPDQSLEKLDASISAFRGAADRNGSPVALGAFIPSEYASSGFLGSVGVVAQGLAPRCGGGRELHSELARIL